MTVTNEAQVLGGGLAVITGAGAGIGAGIARRCGAIGMTVVATDIDKSAAQSVADEIIAAGGKAEALQIDVARPAALDELAEVVFAKYGAVRLLVNNAGIETVGNTWEIPTDRWEATLNINIHGVVHGCRAFIPRMLAAGTECWIANLASIGAFGVMPTQTAYIMSKHAVEAFSECLHLELLRTDAPIHIASVIPGMLKTTIFDASRGAGEPENAARHRATMASLMAAHGMDLEEGCTKIVAKIAAGEFWVDTQEEMTNGTIEGRIAFLRSRKAPVMHEAAKQLLDD